MKSLNLLAVLMILAMCLVACDSGDDDSTNPWGYSGSDGDNDDDGDDGDGDQDYVCKSCTDEPDAIPADDNRSTGVYKAVLTGSNSTGTVKATVATDESTGSCEMTVDDEDYEADDFQIDSEGEYVVYTFSSGDFVVEIVVAADGTIIRVTVTVNDEPMEATMIKEESDQLVKCFEGTWTSSDDDSGIWNFITYGSALQGYSDGNGGMDFSGEVSGSSVTIYAYEMEVAHGTISGDKITGTYDVVDVSSGAWEGYRTL